MKTLITTTMLCAVLFSTQAQITFEKAYGGNGADFGHSVQQTADGGYVIAGSTDSYGAGFHDVYLIKTDASGDIMWTKAYGGTGWDRGYSVQQTADGGFVIAGLTTSFGASGTDYIYLIKTDASGDTMWTKAYGAGGGGSNTWGNSVQQTADGGYVIAGSSVLIKTDNSGDTMWAKFVSGVTEFSSVQQTADGGYVIAGYTTSFGAGSADVYLVKTNSVGDTMWTKAYGGIDFDIGHSVQQTTDGGYVIAGLTWSFGAGSADAYLIKTDASGDTMWTKAYGGLDVDNAHSVQQTADGGYVIAGTTVSFGPGFGIQNVYLIKTDASGDTMWTKAHRGRINSDYGDRYVQQTADGGYVITGDPSFGASVYDFYLLKTDSNGNTYGCSYPGTATVISNTATQVSSGGNFVVSWGVIVSTTSTIVSNTSTISDVNVPTLSISSLSSTNTTCEGICDGTATVNATTGTYPPFSYQWNDLLAQTTATADSLCDGSYVVAVTDNLGCLTVYDTIVVNNSVPSISLSSSSTNATCEVVCDGNATVNATGTYPPFSYQWSDSLAQTTAMADSLCDGSYVVAVTDNYGCLTVYDTITVNNDPLPTLTVTISNPTTFCQGSSTVLTSSAANSYSWSNGETTQSITVISAGSYTVTINGGVCSVTSAPITITVNPSPATPTISGPTTFCQGDILTSSPADNYLWSTGETTQSISITSAGSYTVTITDANGCSATSSVYFVNFPQSSTEVFLTSLAFFDQASIAATPLSGYYSLPASMSYNPGNPRNLLDPGKYVRFKIQCENQQLSGQSIIIAECRIRTASPYIIITDSTSGLNNIGWGADAWSTDEFEIYIDPATPAGYEAKVHFIVIEGANEFATNCITIPIRPLIFSQTTPAIINDDSNPDSNGDDDGIAEPAETIEFLPYLDNISTFNTDFIRGSFENLDNLSGIYIWDGDMGVSGPVYSTSWWNYAFGAPQTINAGDVGMVPEFDFVFDYNYSSTYRFDLHLVMAGGFYLFGANDSITLINWTLPYNFNSSYPPAPNVPPFADFTANTTNIAAGQSVTFTDLSTGNPTSWSWLFAGGTPGTSTSNSPTITYNTGGIFDVTLTATNTFGSGSFTKTGYINVISTGINKTQNLQSLNIYPNPNTGEFIVTFKIPEKQDNISIKVTNIKGQVIYEENLNNFTGQYYKVIDLSKYAKGIYNLQLSTKENTINKKIILE